MTLLPRLRAIIRKTARGANYSDEVINNAIHIFIGDITCVLTAEFLQMQSDQTLESLYWAWERTAIKFPDFESRIGQVMRNFKPYLGMPSEEPTKEEESNVVNLFTVH